MSAHFHFLPVAAADVSSVGFFIFFLSHISSEIKWRLVLQSGRFTGTVLRFVTQ